MCGRKVNHHPEHTTLTVKHGCCSNASYYGVAFFQQEQGSYVMLNTEVILDKNLFDAAKDLRLGWRSTLQQDNDLKHLVRATLEVMYGSYQCVKKCSDLMSEL